MDIDGALADKNEEWIIKEGEDFFVSIGFDPLPTSFYEKSSMLPAPADAEFKKNNHASAWHMDLENDLRCLMSVEPTADYYETIHHELGHIYYYQAYTSPDVPPLLRGGANRGYHEAIGSLLGLAAMQKPFLAAKGLVDADAQVDETQNLLKEALNCLKEEITSSISNPLQVPSWSTEVSKISPAPSSAPRLAQVTTSSPVRSRPLSV